MHMRTMQITDYDQVATLFRETEGVTFREADSYEATAQYLARNPGLSFVALQDEEIIACVMSGHDGRRGYLQHLIVKPAYRRHGIAKTLVSKVLTALRQHHIYKTHCFAFCSNTTAQDFWISEGWELREDVLMYSYNTSGHPNI